MKMLTRKRRHTSLRIMALGLFIAGICGWSFAVASPSTFRITIGTFAPYYSPKMVQVLSGTSISWENPTYDLHTITHDACRSGEHCAFDSGPVGPNRSFTVPHLPPGTYPYHCTLHPIMRGTLVVHDTATSSEI